jgi:hypothetical protein
MVSRTAEVSVTARPVDIDACPTCRLFWFDQFESTSLKPRATLDLFQYIASVANERVTPLASRFNCPRCDVRLEPTRDLQRTTAFTYWRCDFRHGRLISFNQFLREKNFIRAPSPAELAQLRATIRTVSCSQCGAPVDLASASACSHCAAPIALIDPDGVTKALRQLMQPGTSGATAASDDNRTSATLRDAQIDALLDLERRRLHRETEREIDMVSIGAQAIGALLGALLAR